MEPRGFFRTKIFNRGYHYLVGTASPASEYLRELPRWLKKNSPQSRRICILHSTSGTFGSQVARGVVEAARAAGIHSVELLSTSSPIAGAPEALVLAGSFQEEVAIIKRQQWPETVKVIAAVAGVAGVL